MTSDQLSINYRKLDALSMLKYYINLINFIKAGCDKQRIRSAFLKIDDHVALGNDGSGCRIKEKKGQDKWGRGLSCDESVVYDHRLGGREI